MLLYRWGEGLWSRLFGDEASNVRLYCADGQVLYEIYERNRQEGDPVLDKEEASRDFFRAVINEIFQNHYICSSRPIRISEIADYFEHRAALGGYDSKLLPICFFFASVWAIDFKDKEDPSNDSDYRTRRFKESLRWGSGGSVNLECNPDRRYFSDGIVRLFDLLARQYSGQLFMPPMDFRYRQSHADGITISHSIFRYGEVANLYTVFSEKGLSPDRTYEDAKGLFTRLADKYFNNDWRNSRYVDAETLVDAIEKLYDGWDGKPVENYGHYIRKNSGCAQPRSNIQMTSGYCKAYWSLIPDSFNQLCIGICLDKISGCRNGIVVGNEGFEITIPAEAVTGISCYQWLENGDQWTNTPGWIDLKSGGEILFKDGNVRLDAIISFNKCFDGHAVILLQSYVPPAGGNPIWRLMVGGQGIELWGGDARPRNPQYAIMAPKALKDGDVQCAGKDHIDELGSLNVAGKVYYVYRLCGDLRGALIVNDLALFNFGIKHDPIDAKEYFSSERLDIRKLYGRDYVAPPRTTVFYLPNENKIAVYCPLDVDDMIPILYVVSENNIRYCEIDPSMRRHKYKLKFDMARELWITAEFDEIPYAIGLPPKEGKEISFRTLDEDAVDYHKSWKGYFLPKMDDEWVVTGALLARGWIRNVHNLLRSERGDTGIVAEEGFSVLTNLLDDALIKDAEEKLAFIKDIGRLLLTNVVNGIKDKDVRCRPGFGYFRKAFPNVPKEFDDFLNCISKNGQMPSLKEYFAWALILLSIHSDRVGIEKRLKDRSTLESIERLSRLSDRTKSDTQLKEYGSFRMTLKGFELNPDTNDRTKYCPFFVCEGIVHAVLDGVNDEEAQRIVARGVALADNLVSQLIKRRNGNENV